MQIRSMFQAVALVFDSLIEIKMCLLDMLFVALTSVQ
jgi:hypothetical protein